MSKNQLLWATIFMLATSSGKAYCEEPLLDPAQQVSTSEKPTGSIGGLIDQTQIKYLSGRVLLDGLFETSGVHQFDKNVEFVAISTPTYTLATNHADLWLNESEKRLCARFDDGSSGCLALVPFVGGSFSSSTLRSAAISLVAGNPVSITTITIPTGDWMVVGKVSFLGGGSTSVTAYQEAISLTDSTLPGTDTISTPDANGQVRMVVTEPASVGASDFAISEMTVFLHLTTATTYYLVSSANFSVSTMKTYGSLLVKRIK